MCFLSLNEAKEKLMLARPGLYADFVSIFNNKVKEQSSAYQLFGAVVIKTPWCGTDKNVWYICDIGNSDMDSALVELKKNNKDCHDIIMIYARELYGIYSLVFSNFGKPYIDNEIRSLNENNSKDMRDLTTISDEDDIFTKSISQNIFKDFLKSKTDTTIHLLGLFNDNELAGAISAENVNNGEVIVVRDLFVAKEHRRFGFSCRLINAALNLYPGVRYSYSCGSDNYASVAAAKRTCFVFEGTYDFLDP